MHVFEVTSQVIITPDMQIVTPDPNGTNNFPPVQLIFCLKHENSKKINSHRCYQGLVELTVGGYLMLLAGFCGPKFVSLWTSERDPARIAFSNSGVLFITKRTSVGRAEIFTQCWVTEDESSLTPSLQRNTLNTKSLANWIRHLNPNSAISVCFQGPFVPIDIKLSSDDHWNSTFMETPRWDHVSARKGFME